MLAWRTRGLPLLNPRLLDFSLEPQVHITGTPSRWLPLSKGVPYIYLHSEYASLGNIGGSFHFGVTFFGVEFLSRTETKLSSLEARAKPTLRQPPGIEFYWECPCRYT